MSTKAMVSNLILLSSLWLVNVAAAVDHRVEALKEPVPANEISAQIAGQLAPTGVRVLRGGSTPLCDIWLCKDLTVLPDFKPTAEILYPFQPGQLVGVVRFSRKSADFRDQEIAAGTYTLRYAQQPVDGAHVGTSPTRDFLLLGNAKKDQTPDLLESKALIKQSAEAAGTSHPALLALKKNAAEATAFPAIRHDEEHDWWIVAMQVPVKSGAAGAKPLVCELVVVGVAAE